jgi:hypothetical protein
MLAITYTKITKIKVAEWGTPKEIFKKQTHKQIFIKNGFNKLKRFTNKKYFALIYNQTILFFFFQGFIEIFNKTTFQWVPICDNRFSERNAEVVCRQLGFSTLNVYLDFEQRIEYR